MCAVARDGALPLFREDAGFDAVQAELAARGLSDGLPQVPPSERRMQGMLHGVAAPERSYGPMPPMFGELTPWSVGYACVLAGCVPAELPVVLSASR